MLKNRFGRLQRTRLSEMLVFIQPNPVLTGHHCCPSSTGSVVPLYAGTVKQSIPATALAVRCFADWNRGLSHCLPEQVCLWERVGNGGGGGKTGQEGGITGAQRLQEVVDLAAWNLSPFLQFPCPAPPLTCTKEITSRGPRRPIAGWEAYRAVRRFSSLSLPYPPSPARYDVHIFGTAAPGAETGERIELGCF